MMPPEDLDVMTASTCRILGEPFHGEMTPSIEPALQEREIEIVKMLKPINAKPLTALQREKHLLAYRQRHGV